MILIIIYFIIIIIITLHIDPFIYIAIDHFKEEVYKSAAFKKYTYYIFEIIRYQRKKMKKIKFNIPSDDVENQVIDISFNNKIFIVDNSNNFLDSGVYYKDIYSRVTNNNIDFNGDYITIIPNDRINKYIKIWKKTENINNTNSKFLIHHILF